MTIEDFKRKGYEAVLFDMDGTLIDSTLSDYKAWSKLLEEYGSKGMPYQEYIKKLGIKSENLIHEYLDISTEEVTIALKKKSMYFTEIIEREGLKAIENVEECLQRIRKNNFKIALATAARKDKLTEVFSRLKLKQYFDVIITAEDVKFGKPDPEIFIKAAKKLNVDFKKCIVIEDAEKGVEAAKKANMFCIAISTTTPPSDLKKADLIIENYKDLLKDGRN